ncbi:exodeoxyribonuclease V subunit gamma [Arhodomonas sp. AD133]|uniref:exodeoxyribonuclease V subunit gamma n=1 Tax=Arhodomonas sp. AD133 TaxID=3415009 RepID=UPI003EB957B6
MPGFIVIHGNHMEDLRDVVVHRIAGDPLPPLTPETFLIQSHGMAQWLRLALADDDALGISASTRFVLPSRFLWESCQQVLARESLADSPFEKAQLTWRLMRLLPEVVRGEPETFAPLAHYLADDPDGRRRWQLAARLADLFDQYQVYRPDWLDAWAAGEATAEAVENLAPWQPALWRAVLADVPADRRDERRGLVFRTFTDALSSQPPEALADVLPPRLFVFGLSALPPAQLEALVALGRVCEVTLLVMNPCRYFWGDVIDPAEALRKGLRRGRHRRKAGLPEMLDESSLHLHANPLLAAWGRQGRDFIDLLHGHDAPEDYPSVYDQIDLFRDRAPANGPAALLQQIQQDVLDLEPTPPSPAERRPVAEDDRSVVFQSGYGPLREVEMLHDHLLRTFERLPELQPRDIIVMVPDVAAYAPLIEAVFGRHGHDDPRRIPYSIADRPARGSAPLLKAVEQLLSLPENRFTASEVLDLLEVPAFRARFTIDEAELPTLQRWIDGAGVRWGLDGEQREAFDLPGETQNTWRFGLQRMLLGYAAGDSAPWSDVVPYPEVGGLEADLAGRLAAVLECLAGARTELAQPALPHEWVRRLLAIFQRTLAPTDEQEQHHLSVLEEALATWQAACEAGALNEPVSLAVLREALWEDVEAHSGAQRFLAGRVNVCTLMPMRAIPFRVVCLLGMNDGDYPRQRPVPDFDLMARRPRPGDRSRREDDRYLFLEAVLSARDELYISHCGRDPQDDSPRPPSVLVGHLRDTIAAGWHLETDTPDADDAGERLLAALTTEHPLQPFSRRYFREDALPPTYAAEWAGVHEPTTPGTADVGLPPPTPPETPLALVQLDRLLSEPAEVFFHERLGVYLRTEEIALADDEPFAGDALVRHRQIDAILKAAIAEDRPAEESAERLRLAGALPAAGFGELARDALADEAATALEHYQAATADVGGPRPPLEIGHKVTVSPAVTLTLSDWLADLRDGADGPVRIVVNAGEYGGGRGKAHYWLRAWPRHLAACTWGVPLTTRLVCRDRVLSMPPLTEPRARALLDDLIRAWWEAQRSPLPIARGPALNGYLPQRLPMAKLRLTGQVGEVDEALARAHQHYEEPPGHGGAPLMVANRHLARAFPSFQAMAEGFPAWAERLYLPLWQAIHGDPEGRTTP